MAWNVTLSRETKLAFVLADGSSQIFPGIGVGRPVVKQIRVGPGEGVDHRVDIASRGGRWGHVPISCAHPFCGLVCSAAPARCT